VRKQLHWLAALGVAIASSACVTLGDQTGRFSYLLNRPLADAVERLGHPRQDRLEDGMRHVAWDFSYDGYLPAATSASAAGTVGASGDAAASSGWTRYRSRCTLEAVVDERDYIVGLDWAGDYCDYVSNKNRHKTDR
jgi:hypothetical protein